MNQELTTRRDFIALMSAAGLTGLGPVSSLAQQPMPRRPIPSTGETLPVVGLGSSKVVSEVSTRGAEPLAAVLRALVAGGGRVVDTWPRDAENDAGLGRVLSEPDLRFSPPRSTKRADRPASMSSVARSVSTAGRRSIWSRYSA